VDQDGRLRITKEGKERPTTSRERQPKGTDEPVSELLPTSHNEETPLNAAEPEYLTLKEAAETAYKRLHGTPFCNDLDTLQRTPSGRIREMMRQIVSHGFACGSHWPNQLLGPIDAKIRRDLVVLNDEGDLALSGETEPLIRYACVKPDFLERFVQLFGSNI
jgi:hypothetical protein